MGPRIPIDRWGPAFAWLRENAGLSDPQIATAFGCSPNAIAQARSRHQRREPRPSALQPGALPTSRTELGFSEAVGRQAAERLFEEVDEVFAEGMTCGDFIQTSRKLRRLLPRVGNPSSVELLDVAARIHQHRAWLSVHQSYSAHALNEGLKALALLEAVFKETEGRRVKRRSWEVGLVCSLAHLNSGHPLAAEKFLRDATRACAEIQGDVGSEHYRQKASVLIQLGYDADALVELKSASDAAVEVDHLPADGVRALVLPGVRQAAFLEGEWEKARDALSAIGARPAALSVAAASHLTWALATALDSDSSEAQRWAGEQLATSWEGLQRRGHQNAVFFLLSVTPSLRLGSTTLHHWLRWVMHVNPYSAIDPDRSVRG